MKKRITQTSHRSLFEKQELMEALKEKAEYYFFIWEDFSFFKIEVVLSNVISSNQVGLITGRCNYSKNSGS